MLPLSAERYRTEQTGCQIRKAIPVAGTVTDRDPEFMGALFQETGFRDIQIHENGRGWLCVTARK